LERLLKSQDWGQIVARVPRGDRGQHPLALVTHAGHVGLYAGPPMTPRSLLAVYDPLQLRRLEPDLRQAGAQARQQQLRFPDHPLQRMQNALEFLARKPWPAIEHTAPTTDQAAQYMRDQRIAFLASTPYQRPPGHDAVSRTAAEDSQ
jgi:hypothetical protein